MTINSAWLSPDSQTRADTRVTPIGAVTPVGELQGRSGVLPGSSDGKSRITGLDLTGTGAMTATVGVGRAVIQTAAARGAYPVAVTDPVPLTFAGGDAQYSRIDLVVLRIYDDAYDGLTRNEAAVEVVKGTPAATPAVPATPDAALALFSVTVPAGASATKGIDWTTARTDLRTATVAVGGILPSTNADSVAGAYPGQYRDAPNGILQRWNGTLWQRANTPYHASSLDAGSTTSTTYTAALTGTTVTSLDLVFIAPPTGAVILHFGARMWTANNTTTSALMAPKITAQDGTVYFAPNDEYACSHGGPIGSSVSTMWRLYGLTLGATYTMTAMHRSGDATVTSWFDNIFMRVEMSS
ncbi:hypothetical protein ACIHEJ_25175 [Streptomyces sp. NPDC052301]|uniref:hypothetical protein n=1 Tax=Streptomyces sp. NPDC052301 TaxID=3365687 RepID=UPI0037D5AFEB